MTVLNIALRPILRFGLKANTFLRSWSDFIETYDVDAKTTRLTHIMKLVSPKIRKKLRQRDLADELKTNRKPFITMLHELARTDLPVRERSLLERRALEMLERTDASGLWREVTASRSEAIRVALCDHPYKAHDLEYARKERIQLPEWDLLTQASFLAELSCLRDDFDDDFVSLVSRGYQAALILFYGQFRALRSERPELVARALHEAVFRNQNKLHMLARYLTPQPVNFAQLKRAAGPGPRMLSNDPFPDAPVSVHTSHLLDRISSAHDWLEFISSVGDLEHMIRHPEKVELYIETVKPKNQKCLQSAIQPDGSAGR